MRTSTIVVFLTLVGAPLASAGNFVVQGAFFYQDKSWDFGGWTGADPIRPVRRADVVVVDTWHGVLLGVGSTGANGAYSIACFSPFSSGVVSVYCLSTSANDPSLQSFRVTDTSDVAYALAAPSLQVATLGIVNIPPATAFKSVASGNENNPFNVFDVAVDAFEYVDQEFGQSPSPSVVKIQSPAPSSKNTVSGLVWIGADDGYDDAVVLHELGHKVQGLHSNDTTPGGNHSLQGSDQDPRLSFSEGFGTAFAGATLARVGHEPLYQDATGGGQVGGWGNRLYIETAVPLGVNARGAASESGVACALFDILDDQTSPDGAPGVDDDSFVAATTVAGASVQEAFWEVFTGHLSTSPTTTLADFYDGWLGTHLADQKVAELQGAFQAREIFFSWDAGEYDSEFEYAQPIVAGVEVERTLYDFVPWPYLTLPGRGDEDWFEIDLVKGSEITVETHYPSALVCSMVDPRLELYAFGAFIVMVDEDGGVGRNAKIPSYVAASSGVHRICVRSANSLRPYGRYSVTLDYLFENLEPKIVSLSVKPQKKANPLLTAVVTDQQSLTYEWTSKQGGKFKGSGAQVEFVPSGIGPHSYEIQLKVIDALGASSTAFVKVTP